MIKKNKKEIKFWSNVPGIAGIKECQPYKGGIPEWWKNSAKINKSAKECPSFHEVFSSFYTLPMWSDCVFRYDNEYIYYETPHEAFSFEVMKDESFLNMLPENKRSKYVGVVKLDSPWCMKTPHGYSTYVTNPQYEFNEDFSVLSGIIRTDHYHLMNQQIILNFNDKKEIFIERGQPLATLIPFKREKIEYKVEEMDSRGYSDYMKSIMMGRSKFKRGYSYSVKD